MADSQGSLRYTHPELWISLWSSDYEQDQWVPLSRQDLGTSSSFPYVSEINTGNNPISYMKRQCMKEYACFMTVHQVHIPVHDEPAVCKNLVHL